MWQNDTRLVDHNGDGDGLGPAVRWCALPGRFCVRTLADVPVSRGRQGVEMAWALAAKE